MESKEWEKWMVDSTEAGKKLVLSDNYAFLMESSSIEYIQERECELEQAGGLIDQKSYAIAYRRSNFYSFDFSLYPFSNEHQGF